MDYSPELRAQITELAKSTAEMLDVPAGDWRFAPAIEFAYSAEQYVAKVSGELRFCLAFLTLLIDDVRENLAGNVPYETLRERLDTARANVQRALRLAVNALASDLEKEQGLEATFRSCSTLAGEYWAEIARLNKQGE